MAHWFACLLITLGIDALLIGCVVAIVLLAEHHPDWFRDWPRWW